MKPPLVSVLMPAYNAASFVRESIDSVLRQTHQNLELVVVDDGSTDATAALIGALDDPRIRFLRQANAGQSAALNHALQHARGSLCVFLDADDILGPQSVAAQVERLATGPAGAVAFGPWGRFYGSPDTTRCVPEPFWRDIDPLTFHCEMWERHSMVQGGAYLIPRELIDLAGPWRKELALANDFEFFPRVLLRASRLLFTPRSMLHYRSGLVGTLSGQKSQAAWRSAFAAIKGGTDALLAVEDSPRTRRAASRSWEVFRFEAYPRASELSTAAGARISELGGPYYELPVSTKVRWLARLVGWKLAKRALDGVHRLRGIAR